MGVINVRRSRKLMEQARESVFYRKLAFTDELTGLANRTAFKEDLEQCMKLDRSTGEEKILPTVVYMFDLNDLKKCNDIYDHDYEDQYIKMSADTLKKIFAKEGRGYSIDGGEFCVGVPCVSLDEIHEKLSLLEREVAELNDKGFVVTVSIAVGYADYEESEGGGVQYDETGRRDGA